MKKYIRAYMKYLLYVLKHKWFVFIECCRLGIPWRGITHDLSKFLPSEFFPYAHNFHLDPKYVGKKEFEIAWLHHQRKNKHHWQYWVVPRLDDDYNIYPMPEKYVKEMLADWVGAGKAQGQPNTRKWYKQNKDKMILHPKTRAWIEVKLFGKTIA